MRGWAAWHLGVRVWNSLHVEHRGAYSIERLQQLHEFLQQRHYQGYTSATLHSALLMLTTPTVCLIVALVPEFLPLKPPDSEPSTSSYFWVTFWLTMGAFVLAGVTEIDYCISDLNYRPWMLVLTTVIYSTVITAAYFALVPILGFPLPFSPVVLNFPVFAVLFTIVWAPLGPIHCMRRSVRRQLQLHIVTVSAKASMAIVYPLFCYIFRVVDAKTQLPLTLLLPSVKMMEKLLMHYVTTNLPDLQPLLITFNVEVFNTLFVSICLRSSTSLAVTALLMLTDFLSACISIYRLRDLMIHIDLLNAKLGANVTREHMLDIAAFSITHFNADGKSTKSTRKVSVAPTSKTSVVAFNTNLEPNILPLPKKLRRNAVNPAPSALFVRGETWPRPVCFKTGERLSHAERQHFVHEALRILRRTEFMLLVEFTEVVVPLVYVTYVVTVYHLPNRIFFLYFQDMSTVELQTTIQHVLGYGALQLASFLMLLLVLSRRFHLSPIAHLHFVLQKEWKLVQCQLVLWVVYVLQSSLVHLGIDYTFKFNWIGR